MHRKEDVSARKNIFFKSLLNGFFLLSCALIFFSFSVNPLVEDFGTKGRLRVRHFTLHNDKQHPISVEISAWSRETDIDGKDDLKEAEEDFLIFPMQIVLMAGESQRVRTTLLLEETPKKELAYRFLFP